SSKGVVATPVNFHALRGLRACHTWSFLKLTHYDSVRQIDKPLFSGHSFPHSLERLPVPARVRLHAAQYDCWTLYRGLFMAIVKKKSAFNLKRASKAIEEQVAKLVKGPASKAALALAQTQSALVDYYLLIDFGFTANQPFQPNSVQFYSNTTGFLCSKIVDNASLVSLVPILNCKQIRVTWNTATQEAVHVYGIQPK
ncbi:MAG: hypothetical protein AABP62_30585, partial [Planctomycetota bacterium]